MTFLDQQKRKHGAVFPSVKPDKVLSLMGTTSAAAGRSPQLRQRWRENGGLALATENSMRATSIAHTPRQVLQAEKPAAAPTEPAVRRPRMNSMPDGGHSFTDPKYPDVRFIVRANGSCYAETIVPAAWPF